MFMPLPLAEIAPAIDPTTVTSSPSRIHTVPNPIRISQCHRDQGRRSSLAGMFVSMVPRLSSPANSVADMGYLLFDRGATLAQSGQIHPCPGCQNVDGRARIERGREGRGGSGVARGSALSRR